MAKRKGEYDDRLEVLLTTMQTHIKEDSDNFKHLAQQIIEVNQDVKSLLQSRSFLRGAWFALGVGGALVAAVTTALIQWFK